MLSNCVRNHMWMSWLEFQQGETELLGIIRTILLQKTVLITVRHTLKMAKIRIVFTMSVGINGEIKTIYNIGKLQKAVLPHVGKIICGSKAESAWTASGESIRVSDQKVKRTSNESDQNKPGKRFSIKTLPDGKQYVEADRDVITGNDPSKWRSQITQYINQTIRNGKDVTVYAADGDALTITRNTAGKAAFLNNVKQPDGTLRKMTDEEYAVKLRAESHIDECGKSIKTWKA